MLGILLTGHGSFSEGMKGALELIAGPQENFIAVPFLEEFSLENFQAQLDQGCDELLKNCEGVVILSDLLGGTPFKSAMMTARDRENVVILAGINLPILVESTFSRLTEDNAHLFANKLIEIGKAGLVSLSAGSFFESPVENFSENSEDEEGI